MKISAVQAAQLVGRNERRIRDWIATRRLPAIKVGQSWQIDIEDLERLPGITIDRTQLEALWSREVGALSELRQRVRDLEEVVLNLRNEVAQLKMRLQDIEGAQRASVLFEHAEQIPLDLRMYATVTPPFPDFEDRAGGQEVEPPPGSVRVKQFALIHKVHAAMLTYQIETGKIEDTPLSMGNGRKAHWLTPEQQRAVIVFWRRNGTHFVPCPICPHTAM
ncbi:helix-turn-helix domain-containing protein [Reticulibacter mediterranei]|uniref:helix-turn-helix domain-containing protein n=1 Tax=Reticulibacter mediterranei TaxID=2778369 RepID=UPI001C68B3E5|nr:helix-turn-helix domain-containing protein [Reticulibacter mediterranei]